MNRAQPTGEVSQANTIQLLSYSDDQTTTCVSDNVVVDQTVCLKICANSTESLQDFLFLSCTRNIRFTRSKLNERINHLKMQDDNDYFAQIMFKFSEVMNKISSLSYNEQKLVGAKV